MPTPQHETSGDFDFFVGQWTCRHRYLTERLAGSIDWIEFPGTCTMEKILGGLGNFDQNTIELPGGPYLGASLRLYDPATAGWSIRWLDSRRPGQITPPVIGRFDNGIGIFYGDDRFGEKPIRVRFIWSRITRGAARWEQAFSSDEGNSWETNWFMDFTRRGGTVMPACDMTFVESFLAPWNAHDVDGAMALMTDDCIWEVTRGSEPHGRRIEGSKAVRAAIAEAFRAMPDIHYQPVHCSFGPDHVVVELQVSATLADGGLARFHACDVMTVRNGKVATKRSYRKVIA